MSSVFNSKVNPNLANNQANKQRFLRFTLNSQIDCLLSLPELKGAIEIMLPKILPVPQVEEYWLGIINWRGEAVWILDLAKLLGAKNWCEGEIPPQSAVAILVGNSQQTIGMLVKQAKNLESYDINEILPISSLTVPGEISPCFQGYFLDDRKQPLILLDIKSTIEDILKN